MQLLFGIKELVRVFQNSQLNNELPDYGNNSLQMYPFIQLFLSLDVVQNDPILVLWFYLNFTWSTKCCLGEKNGHKKGKGHDWVQRPKFSHFLFISFPQHLQCLLYPDQHFSNDRIIHRHWELLLYSEPMALSWPKCTGLCVFGKKKNKKKRILMWMWPWTYSSQLRGFDREKT